MKKLSKTILCFASGLMLLLGLSLISPWQILHAEETDIRKTTQAENEEKTDDSKEDNNEPVAPVPGGSDEKEKWPELNPNKDNNSEDNAPSSESNVSEVVENKVPEGKPQPKPQPMPQEKTERPNSGDVIINTDIHNNEPAKSQSASGTKKHLQSIKKTSINKSQPDNKHNNSSQKANKKKEENLPQTGSRSVYRISAGVTSLFGISILLSHFFKEQRNKFRKS